MAALPQEVDGGFQLRAAWGLHGLATGFPSMLAIVLEKVQLSSCRLARLRAVGYSTHVVLLDFGLVVRQDKIGVEVAALV